MGATKTVVYRLHVNTVQYRYLQHQIQLTRGMYLTMCKEVQKKGIEVQRSHRKRLGVYSEKEVMDLLKAYQRHYMTQMEACEVILMANDVMQFQSACLLDGATRLPTFYACNVVHSSLDWRGIKLYPMLEQTYVSFYPWYFTRASLYYKRQFMYLRIYLAKGDHAQEFIC